MKFILRWFVSAISIYVIAYLMEGINVTTYEVTLLAAAIFGIANAIIRPVLVLLTFPITIITLGLFTFVINGVILMATARIVDGFTVGGLLDAIIGSILISIVNVLLSNLLGVKKK